MPAPQHCPTPRELDDLEVLLSGALAPRTTFDDQLTLVLPAELAEVVAAGDEVELVDPEGLPLARYSREGLVALGAAAYGPFRRLQLTPAQAREAHAGALVVPVAAPLSEADLAFVGERAAGRDVVLLTLSGTGTPQDVSPVGLVRTSLVAARLLTAADTPAHVVVVPLPAHGDADLDHALGQQVAAAYGEDVVALPPDDDGSWPDEIAAAVAQDQPGDEDRGVVVLFTGLSGSGKSTLARALHDLVLEDGRRTVTSLDGDVVRRHLSAGLSFSKADRETNIRRIGWVAAEIARHRGVAICSPIAPFDATRQQVRAMVEDAGGELVLVHVATPLEECERRDRKGLYAKARRGEIPEFTGISSPYEVPADADVAIDTTGRSVEDCLAELLPHLPFGLEGPA
ncbi:sulfate adenylyltransferase [Nocardioides scoriae]|uniref:Adenylyl-sulfate kinase n=1 Tax=Nocardioides scoriae TaxID=642780 RepID=A0A1H1X1B1_9ACTN|nr:adenylyl-sulfate kinase [Nocardioides scoriae]SDT03155.1 sulfate adenylyltransferase [Nocardioides scoriae]